MELLTTCFDFLLGCLCILILILNDFNPISLALAIRLINRSHCPCFRRMLTRPRLFDVLVEQA
jgi:hypothetical protein